ncbi:MAG: hypothetical protein ACOC5T_04095 [Elusimicrobiota bacterium]
MAEMIYVDDNGNELRREIKGKGRPPRGSEKQENGDFIVRPVKDETFHPEYVDLDSEGNVLSRSLKGRGRAKPGYVKQTDGEYKGHWLKTVTKDAEDTENTDVTVTDVNNVTTVTEESTVNSNI